MIYEACIENYSEGIAAENMGATRLELCENLSAGGTTPSYGTIKKLTEDVNIPVMVMVRPRGGGFVYSPEEIEIMAEDIRLIKNTRAAGIVLGVLKSNGTIDTEATKKLVALARPLKVTFHKAIDELNDILEGVRRLKEIGIDGILSSGGSDTAIEGAATLNRIIELADEDVDIISAGRITDENIDEIKKLISGSSFHGKRIVGDLN